MATGANFFDKSIPGGVVHNPASAYSREMVKWEMGYSPYGPPGRPREQVGHQPWPAMFYKAKRSSTNGDFLVEHYQEAADEVEARNLESRGYRNGLPAAIAYVEQCEQAAAVASAESNYTDRNMSEKARAEKTAAEAATSSHLAQVPVTPIRKRRTKAEMAAAKA
jgi:hypothetical protein